MSRDVVSHPEKGAVHCVLLTPSGGVAPTRLRAALERREIKPLVVADAYTAMAELCERSRDENAAALILLLVSPTDTEKALSLVAAAEIYVPRASVWMFDETQKPELREINAEALVAIDHGPGGEAEIRVHPEIESIARERTRPRDDGHERRSDERSDYQSDSKDPRPRREVPNNPPPLRLVDDTPTPVPTPPPVKPPVKSPAKPKPKKDPEASADRVDGRTRSPETPDGEVAGLYGGVVGPGFSATNLRPVEPVHESKDTDQNTIIDPMPDPLLGPDPAEPAGTGGPEGLDDRIELTPEELNMLLGEASDDSDGPDPFEAGQSTRKPRGRR